MSHDKLETDGLEDSHSLHMKSLTCVGGITLTPTGPLVLKPITVGGHYYDPAEDPFFKCSVGSTLLIPKNQVVIGGPPICDCATKDGEVVLNGWHFLNDGTFHFRDGPCLNMGTLVEDLYGPEGVMCHMLAKKHKTKK